MQHTIEFRNTALVRIAEELHLSAEEVMRDAAFLELQRRITAYQGEIARFSKKYGADLDSIASQRTVEEFETDDDLNDWRFAQEALDKHKRLLAALM